MTQPDKTERSAFETAITSLSVWPSLTLRAGPVRQEYENDTVQMCWELWQQASAAAVKQVQDEQNNPASLSPNTPTQPRSDVIDSDAKLAPRTDVVVPSGRAGEGVASTSNTERPPVAPLGEDVEMDFCNILHTHVINGCIITISEAQEILTRINAIGIYLFKPPTKESK